MTTKKTPLPELTAQEAQARKLISKVTSALVVCAEEDWSTLELVKLIEESAENMTKVCNLLRIKYDVEVEVDGEYLTEKVTDVWHPKPIKTKR